jgi:hypothetical protein
VEQRHAGAHGRAAFAKDAKVAFENVVDKLLRVARLFAAGQNFIVDLVADNVELVLVAMPTATSARSFEPSRPGTPKRRVNSARLAEPVM